MFLFSLLFTTFTASAQAPESYDLLCGENTVEQVADEERIEKICFVKITNLKDSWQVRAIFNNGQWQNYFMKDPVYEQGLSVLSNMAIMRSQLYTESNTGVLSSDIFFYYPLQSSQTQYLEGKLPNGMKFRVPNMGAPGLKAP